MAATKSETLKNAAAAGGAAPANTGARNYGTPVYNSQGTYYDQNITSADTDRLNALSAAWHSANAAGDAQAAAYAHEQAEAIRAQYNYSGGGDGSSYIGIQAGPAKGDAYTPSQLPAASSQESYISGLYSAQQAAALQALKSAYDRNVIDTDALAAKIPETYQAARNQTQAGAEQQRYNWNRYAAASGLNIGTGAQGSLSMANQNMANQSGINAQEANAVNELETQRLKLKTQYENDIAEAVASGNLQKAQALYQEAVRVDESMVSTARAQADENYRAWSADKSLSGDYYSRLKQYAQTLAAIGDYSGYKELGYTDAQIAMMQAMGLR